LHSSLTVVVHDDKGRHRVDRVSVELLIDEVWMGVVGDMAYAFDAVVGDELGQFFLTTV